MDENSNKKMQIKKSFINNKSLYSFSFSFISFFFLLHFFFLFYSLYIIPKNTKSFTVDINYNTIRDEISIIISTKFTL
jgi:hypothetical protein